MLQFLRPQSPAAGASEGTFSFLFAEFAVRNVTVLFHNAAEEIDDEPEADDGEASLAYTGRQLMSLPPDVRQKGE